LIAFFSKAGSKQVYRFESKVGGFAENAPKLDRPRKPHAQTDGQTGRRRFVEVECYRKRRGRRHNRPLSAISPNKTSGKRIAYRFMECFKEMDGTGITRRQFRINCPVPRL
jgi:hypothetical protein